MSLERKTSQSVVALWCDTCQRIVARHSLQDPHDSRHLLAELISAHTGITDHAPRDQHPINLRFVRYRRRMSA